MRSPFPIRLPIFVRCCSFTLVRSRLLSDGRKTQCVVCCPQRWEAACWTSAVCCRSPCRVAVSYCKRTFEQTTSTATTTVFAVRCPPSPLHDHACRSARDVEYAHTIDIYVDQETRVP